MQYRILLLEVLFYTLLGTVGCLPQGYHHGSMNTFTAPKKFFDHTQKYVGQFFKPRIEFQFSIPPPSFYDQRSRMNKDMFPHQTALPQNNKVVKQDNRSRPPDLIDKIIFRDDLNEVTNLNTNKNDENTDKYVFTSNNTTDLHSQLSGDNLSTTEAIDYYESTISDEDIGSRVGTSDQIVATLLG